MSESPKESLFEEFARVGKAVASSKRLNILDLLAQGERTVEELAEAAGLPVKNTSAHLRTLRECRLVETRREGTYVHYRLAGPDVFEFLRGLQALARRRLPAVEEVVRRFYEDPDGLEPVSGEELLRRLRAGDVTVLDVRPHEEYEAGHLPGAESVPLAELEDRLSGFPRDREVVAYCRGPYCLLSFEAVRHLRERGFEARVMEDGLPDWKLRGLPVEVGDVG